MSSVGQQVAIVTGAGRGIGKAIALDLARAGTAVVVNDAGVAVDGTGPGDASPSEEVAAAIRDQGGRAVASALDVTAADAGRRLVELAVDAFGRVDALVNNAGVFRDRSILSMTIDEFVDSMRVDVVGAFALLQAVAKQLIAQKSGGTIVNIASVGALIGQTGQAGIAGAKGALVALSRTAAIELQRHRIRVHAVAPLAKTRATENLPVFEGMDGVTAEHVAPLVAYLLSAEASDKTGLVLGVAGAQMYAFKTSQTDGAFKDGPEPWTAEELHEHWPTIVKG